jgi:hypothetical protein
MITVSLAPAIPTKPYQKNRLVPPAEPRIPEPAPLYCLVVLTLASHVPYPGSTNCIRCNVPWPCDQILLAYRLREGF